MRELKRFSSKVDFPVYCAGFNPAGDVLIGGGGGSQKSGVKNKLALYKLDITKNAFEKVVETELNENEDTPTCITFHHEDDIVACGINSSDANIEAGENKNCRVFRYSNNKIELIKAVQTITSTNIDDYQKVVSFSNDDKFLATGGTDSKLTVLKYPSLEVAFPPVNFNQQEIYDLDFNPVGDQIAVASTKMLQILSTKDGKCIFSLERPTSQKTTECQFRACRFGRGTSDGFLFAVVNSSSKTKAFVVKCKRDATTWERNITKFVSKKPITTFAISDNGSLLAFGASDQSVRVCDTRTLRVLLTIPKVHDFPATTLGFNHDSTLIVSGSVDNSVNIIQLPEKFSAGLIGKYTLFIITLSTLVVILAFFYQMYLMGEQD